MIDAERIPLLRFFPPGARDEIVALFREERYEFGQLVVREGDPADACFVMLRSGEGGQEVIGPIARHERYWVYRLRGKQPPALSDDGVRAMLEQRLLRRHFDDAVALRVSWHCWRPE